MQQGQENDRIGVGAIGAVIREVVDDTYNLALDLIDDNSAAESIALGPIATRHGLVDHGHLRSGVVIGRSEVAALLQRNAHSVKEVRPIEVRHYRFVFAFCGDVTGNTEIAGVAGAPIAHGQVRGDCRRGDAGRIAQAIERIGEEDAGTVVAVAGPGKINHRGKSVGAIESDGAIEDVERGARKQAAACQNDEADAELNAKEDALAESLARRSGNSCTAFVQSFTLGNAQRLTNGVHAANQGNHDGNGSDENGDAPVAMQIKSERKTEVGHQDVNSTRNPDAGSPTGKGTGKCKQTRFDKDLRRNARRPCARERCGWRSRGGGVRRAGRAETQY